MVVRSPTGERQLRTRLTTLKLALQLLERRNRLPDDQRALVRAALEASDALATLVEQPGADLRSDAGRSAGRPAVGQARSIP